MTQKLRCLVVDDEPLGRERIRTLIGTRTDAVVLAEASDGAEATGLLNSKEFDLVFLDSDRTEYVAWWPNLRRVLRPGGALIADNALCHPDELAPFQKVVESDPEFISCVVPVGKGEFFASRFGNSGE